MHLLLNWLSKFVGRMLGYPPEDCEINYEEYIDELEVEIADMKKYIAALEEAIQ